MPDPAAFLDAAGPIAALLAPVVALLFVALRLRKRLRYSHELLSPRDDKKPSAVLLRTLRLYHDAAIDAACAVIVGLALAGYPRPEPRRGPATVLDCSLSMLSGMRGDRPLDEAARLLLSDGSLRNSTLFALGWDPASGRHTLRDITETLENSTTPQELAAALESSEAFLSSEYGLVASLAGRGYGAVSLVTDDGAAEGVGVELRTLAARPPRYLLPASATWDDDLGRSVVRFVAAGGAAISALWELSADGRLSRAKPEDYAIVPAPSGFELSFPEPGLWAVQWEGRILPFRAPGRPGQLRSDGDFANRIARALGSIASPEPGTARAGSGDKNGAVITDGGGSGRPGIVSVSRATTEPCVMPPRSTLGAVVAAGLDRRSDLSLGRAALASPEAALPFWLARQARSAGPEPAPGRQPRPVRVGDGFLYPESPGYPAALAVPPPGEYAPSGRRVIVSAGPLPDRRFLVALALAALYALKLALHRLLRSGTRPARRVGAPSQHAHP